MTDDSFDKLARHHAGTKTATRQRPFPLGQPLLLFAVALVFCLGVFAGCGQQSPSSPASIAAAAGPDIFADVTSGSGIDWTFRNGEEADQFTMVETLGGGIALIDYDQDGLLDVFLTGGGHFGPNQEILSYPCKLYRNEGNWRFRDVTAEVGLEGIAFYTHGAAVGDYDNDGWPDLLITGYGRMALFRNNHGRFEDVTEKAGLVDKRDLHWSTSAAWGDFNGDGYLDLYVAHYVNWSFKNHPACPCQQTSRPRDVCSPRHFEPLPHALYLNNGDGTFREVTETAGLHLGKESGKGLGVLVADFDDDGKLDIYVANDTTDNFLYLNQMGRERRSPSQTEAPGPGASVAAPADRQTRGVRDDKSPLFAEVGHEYGVSGGVDGRPDGSMGVDAADYDGSGKLSIFVANYAGETHALYRQRSNGRFQHSSSPAGIMAIGQTYVGFGASFLDFDLDGAEDLVMANGHAVRYPTAPVLLAQRPVLLHNIQQNGVRRFAQIRDEGGTYFRTFHRGRGLAVGDLDNDGKIDIIVSHCNEPVTLLRNVLETGHHWLGVQLVGKPNGDAIGAKVTLDVGRQKLVRHVKGGGSYLSSSDRRVLFGLGQASQIGKLLVRWPSGRKESWTGLAIDRYCRLTEGEGAPETAHHPESTH